MEELEAFCYTHMKKMEEYDDENVDSTVHTFRCLGWSSENNHHIIGVRKKKDIR